jgi:cell division septum initiation protein DivIVA
VRYRELETLLRTTLVSAERASQELREQARREASVMLEEAHSEARGIRREALADLERMRMEAARIRALLGAALSTLELHESVEEAEVRAA